MFHRAEEVPPAMRSPQRSSLPERGVGEGATMMLTKSAQVMSVSVPVSDQEAAKDFYVDTLGFELLVDNSWREGMRWIEVAPEASATSLMLVSWSDSLPPSLYRVIVIATDHIQAIHEELVAKGIFFDLPPTELSNGTQAMFRDPDGNALVFWEYSSSALRERAHSGSGLS
jgi:catechol 2,3-dioxygenase-like lactoylglutathione lyase family enzyme